MGKKSLVSFRAQNITHLNRHDVKFFFFFFFLTGSLVFMRVI